MLGAGVGGFYRLGSTKLTELAELTHPACAVDGIHPHVVHPQPPHGVVHAARDPQLCLERYDEGVAVDWCAVGVETGGVTLGWSKNYLVPVMKGEGNVVTVVGQK